MRQHFEGIVPLSIEWADGHQGRATAVPWADDLCRLRARRLSRSWCHWRRTSCPTQSEMVDSIILGAWCSVAAAERWGNEVRAYTVPAL